MNPAFARYVGIDYSGAQTIKKVVLGVPEFLGREIVMQFDLPDSTEVAEACGIIMHK